MVANKRFVKIFTPPCHVSTRSFREDCAWLSNGYCNLNTYENEEVAFIGQRSGEPLKWRQFDEISKDTISKIKYTASKLDETWLKSSLAIYHYVKVQLDDICETRR